VGKNLLRALIFIFSLITSISYCFAEDISPGAEPGAQAKRFKSQAEREKKQLEGEKAQPSKIEIQPKEAKPAPEGPVFKLKEVTIIGVTVFKPEVFQPIYEPYLDKTVSFKDIDAIAKGIEDIYNKNGYLTTNVYIPKQRIIDGKVEIQVDEGKRGKLHIEGNKWFSVSLIEKYFHIKKNEILNVKKLQRDVLRLNQNPGLEAKTLISAGEEPQASDITLRVKDKFPWHVGIGFDNQGTRLTGKYRSSIYLRSANVTGIGDSLFVNSLLSSLSYGQSLSYTIPIGTYGTKFGLDATYFKMKLGKEFKSFDITGRTQMYTPRISWELALQEDFSATADLGLDIKSIIKKSGGEQASNDQLRIPFFGFNFTKTDTGGQTSFSPRFNFSTADFLGASARNHPSASRAGTGGFFFKYEQGLSRIQRMPWDSYLSLRSQFQAASHTLPLSEQFQIGGANSVRGYPEGDYLCDMGGSLNVDWAMPMYLIPKGWKLSGSDTLLRHQIEPVIFVDLGAGDLKKVNSGDRRDKLLVGIGGGLRMRFFNKAYCRIEWAKSVGDRPTSGNGPSTFYITFQSEM
jgi:hemolysin activation/secretion protein